MDEVKLGIQYVFQTKNQLTLAVSASGHGGMEAAMCNLVEPGDNVLVAVNGLWGIRAADMATRYGGCVQLLEKPPGQNFTFEEIEEAFKTHKPAIFFITQGESSTGVYQQICGLGEICQKLVFSFFINT